MSKDTLPFVLNVDNDDTFLKVREEEDHLVIDAGCCEGTESYWPINKEDATRLARVLLAWTGDMNQAGYSLWMSEQAFDKAEKFAYEGERMGQLNTAEKDPEKRMENMAGAASAWRNACIHYSQATMTAHTGFTLLGIFEAVKPPWIKDSKS